MMIHIHPYHLKIAVDALTDEMKEIYDDIAFDYGETAAKVVVTHSLGAAAGGFGVAWLPGAGATAAAAAMVGFIWSMYYRINTALHLKLSKTVVKSLASAVMSNIAQAALAVAGTIVLSTILSLTGLGNGVSSILMAALDYAVVLVGGIIYIKLLTNLFKAGKNPEEMTEDDLKKAAEKTVAQENISDMIKNARDDYKKARKSGQVTGKETVKLERDD